MKCRLLVLLVGCLVWSACITPISADVEEGSLEVPGMVIERPKGFMQFGFQKNGTVSIRVTSAHTTPLYLVICSGDEQARFTYSSDDICLSLQESTELCTVVAEFKGELRLFHSFSNFGIYSFNLVNCNPEHVTVNVRAVLMNPGGNHLTATLIPMPVFFSIMAVVWGIVALAWGLHVIVWWQASVGLHYIMLTYPAAKVIFSSCANHYFGYYSVHGTLYRSDLLLYYGSYIGFQVVLYLFLLVISRGWGISKPQLKSDKYYIFSILAGMFIILMFRYLYSTTSPVLELVIALALIGFRVVILVYVYMNVTHTTRQLELAMLNYNIDVQNMDSHYTLIRRHKIYVLLKMILIAWMLLAAGAYFLNFLLYEGMIMNWVDLMNTEFLDFILFALIACNFRLRAQPNLFLFSSSPAPNTSPFHSSPPPSNLGTNTNSNSIATTTDPTTTPQEGDIEMVSLSRKMPLLTIRRDDAINRNSSDSDDVIGREPNGDEVINNAEAGATLEATVDIDSGDDEEVILINKRR